MALNDYENILRVLLHDYSDHDVLKTNLIGSGNVLAKTFFSSSIKSNEVESMLKVQYQLKDFKLSEDYSESLLRLQQIIEVSSVGDQFKIVLIGVAALQLFVRLNWTGLILDDDDFRLDCMEDLYSKDALTKVVTTCLDPEGEGLFPVVKHPELLMLSRLVLIDARSALKTSSWVVLWWGLRCLSIHQEVLTEKSEAIREPGVEVTSKLSEVLEEADVDSRLRALFHVEAGSFHAFYMEISPMKSHIEKSCDVGGIKINEIGRLGKRTRYQDRDLAQLTIDIQKSTKEEQEEQSLDQIENDVDSTIVDYKLNDEVRLDKVKFAEGHQQQQLLNLTPLERAIVLGAFTVALKSQPKDELTREEVLPYLEAVLEKPGKNTCPWSIKMSALLHRSKLESKGSRTVDRAVMQVQNLVDSINTPSNKENRMELIYASRCPPFWTVEGELVALFLATGSPKSALDSALKLQLWEDVISCYHSLQLRHKAAEVIEAQIAKKETPLLRCMLGDATDDISHYYRALEMTENKNSRAYRSLGYYYYYKKEYATAVDFMKKSLELNAFQQRLLLRLGYAAMEIKDWQSAAEAYRKYCIMEPDNFEAWNNLSNAYVKMGQKARAWKVLQEAIKCDYDNWKLWDNILVISTDCAHFEEVIRAYHRLLDLKDGKHVDVEVLKILVRAIVEDLKDNQERPCDKTYRSAALKLFGRVCSNLPGESGVWELYAQLNDTTPTDEVDQRDYKTAQYLQKAVSSAVQKQGWEKETQNCSTLLNLAHRLALAVLKTSETSKIPTQSLQLLSSSKLTLRGILTKIEKSQVSMETGEILEELREPWKVLNTDIENIVAKVAELKK